MRTFFAFLFAVLMVLPAWADDARQEERDALFTALRSAQSPQIAQAATRAIWKLWLTAPDSDAQTLMDFGMKRMAVFDSQGAMKAFDTLIEYAPDYAEAWNQRAFAKFRLEDLEGSLADIEQTLALEPHHFGALSGKYQILMQQGRPEQALKTLRRLIEIHPWTPERGLLGKPL